MILNEIGNLLLIIKKKARELKAIKKSTKTFDITTYVFHKKPANQTRTALYMNVNKPGFTVELKRLHTVIIGNKKNTDALLNAAEGIGENTFETTLEFKYVETGIDHKHLRTFKYLLPGLKHNINIITPDGATLNIKSKEFKKEDRSEKKPGREIRKKTMA